MQKCVDLVELEHSAKSASIPPRTGPDKFVVRSALASVNLGLFLSQVPKGRAAGMMPEVKTAPVRKDARVLI